VSIFTESALIYLQGIETEVFRSNIDVEFIARLYFNGMTGIKDETIFPRKKFSMEYLIENFLEYHLRAIVTENGMKILNNFTNKSSTK
jgi:hypothetical protein